MSNFSLKDLLTSKVQEDVNEAKTASVGNQDTETKTAAFDVEKVRGGLEKIAAYQEEVKVAYEKLVEDVGGQEAFDRHVKGAELFGEVVARVALEKIAMGLEAMVGAAPEGMPAAPAAPGVEDEAALQAELERLIAEMQTNPEAKEMLIGLLSGLDNMQINELAGQYPEIVPLLQELQGLA